MANLHPARGESFLYSPGLLVLRVNAGSNEHNELLSLRVIGLCNAGMNREVRATLLLRV